MAWLPMGGWNNCPTPFAMMMTARRWYEEYGAWPAAVSHDILEFAVEQRCPRNAAWNWQLSRESSAPSGCSPAGRMPLWDGWQAT